MRTAHCMGGTDIGRTHMQDWGTLPGILLVWRGHTLHYTSTVKGVDYRYSTTASKI